jgi:hypothetical protein
MKLENLINTIDAIEVFKEIKTTYNPFKGIKANNNRKTTRGRKRQIIFYQLPKTFPPVIKTKTIIH